MTTHDTSRNHYRVKPPFAVMFSGGETSAFMLRKIVDAFDGKLPEDARVLFCNTGLEHEETLKFVQRVSDEWAIPVVWLEYVAPQEFEVVNFEAASRNGEPFERLVQAKGYLPTPVARVCTSNLKMRTGYHYLKSIGWDEWDSAIGLRADEPRRAQRIRGDHAAETPVCPMYLAGDSLVEVEAFWEAQSWRLGIPRWLGNCCGCFLKSAARLQVIADDYPELLEWWAAIEERTGKPFRLDRPTYRQLLTQVSVQGRLFEDPNIDDDSVPCTCTD